MPDPIPNPDPNPKQARLLQLLTGVCLTPSLTLTLTPSRRGCCSCCVRMPDPIPNPDPNPKQARLLQLLRAYA